MTNENLEIGPDSVKIETDSVVVSGKAAALFVNALIQNPSAVTNELTLISGEVVMLSSIEAIYSSGSELKVRISSQKLAAELQAQMSGIGGAINVNLICFFF